MSWFVKHVSTYRKYGETKKGKQLYAMLKLIEHAELSDEAARMIGLRIGITVGRLNLEALGKLWIVNTDRSENDIYITVYPEGKVDDYVCTITIVRISSSLYVDDVHEIFSTPGEEGGEA